MKKTSPRSRFGLVVLGCGVLFACGREEPSGSATRPTVPEARPAEVGRPGLRPANQSGPPAGRNDENPDPTRVDLALKPFNPKLVGGTFRLAVPPPRSLNAITRVTEEVGRLRKYLFGAPLLMETPDRVRGGFLAVPWAAVSLPEESADGRVHTWTLRDDITWEDGRPVVAEDYVFTLKMMRTDGVPAPQRETFSELESLEALDSHKLRAVWRRPYYRAAVGFGLDFHVAPAHALTSDPAALAATTTHLSCGPYRVAAMTPDALEAVLRDEYRTKPFPPRPYYVERFTWTAATDPTARYSRFLAGEFDLVPVDFDRFVKIGNEPAFRAVGWRAPVRVPSFSAVFWNHRDPTDPERRRPHPLLADVAVRRALDRLFDRAGLARFNFHGSSEPATGPFMPGGDDMDATIKPRAFDPAAARKALEEAGFAAGPDGVLVRAGVRVALKLAFPTGGAQVYVDVPPQVQEAARKAGVEITLVPLPLSAFFDAGGKREYDAVLSLWQTSAVEPDLADTFKSDGAVSGGLNWSASTDADLDRLFDATAAERAPERRAELRRKIHRRLFDMVPCSFLFTGIGPVAVSRRFANIEIHELGIRYWDFVERTRFSAEGLGR